MTMHLAQGLSTINTKKRKTKITKTRLAELQENWRKHNKEMKQRGMHDLRYEKFEDYLDYCFGQVKLDKKKFNSISKPSVYRRDEDHRERYPSVPMSKVDNGSCRKVEPMKYTGTLIKGIATMHKSNAVPVIDDQHAKDIARMRRG
jgi:hypothetical protein